MKFNSDVILFPDVAIANENERLQRQTQSTWWFIPFLFQVSLSPVMCLGMGLTP